MIATIFDTETDDLINSLAVKLDRQPHILSLYYNVVNLSTGTKLAEGSYMFKPPRPISAEITKINGITNEMVQNSPPFSHLAAMIKREFEEQTIIIAHNAAFDRDMINIEMQRCDLQVNWPRIICTVEQTIWLETYRLSLTNLYKLLFNEDFQEKHSASGDVTALARCCVELFNRGWL